MLIGSEVIRLHLACSHRAEVGGGRFIEGLNQLGRLKMNKYEALSILSVFAKSNKLE